MVDRQILTSFLQTKILMRASSTSLARHRDRLWHRLKPALAATPALKPYSTRPLDEYPIIEPSIMRADYGAWNSLGLSHADMTAGAQHAELGLNPTYGDLPANISFGFSTGTSGNRGIFIASAQERADYIGQSLARLLPWSSLIKGARIALILRASNALYSDVGASSRFAFKHIPLTCSEHDMISQVADWQPTILIAPAHRLAMLAKARESGHMAPLPLVHCLTGSEPIGEKERGWIGDQLGIRPDPIYQATEGFLAATCQHGRLHLNEHAIAISKDPLAGTPLWRPIISDLRRRSQPIIQVRLDDLLEDDPRGPCACGYAGRTIKLVFGRAQDIWRWPNRVLTPPEIYRAMDTLLPPQVAWQAIGTPAHIRLSLGQACPGAIRDGIVARLTATLKPPVPILLTPEEPRQPDPKRRQISWQSHTHV
jgi:putative adenylate-forming enzyme